MAAGDIFTFPKFRELWMNGSIQIDFKSSTIYLALVNTLTVAQVNSMNYWNMLQGQEVSGGNYTAGGNSISAQTVSVSTSYPIFMAAPTSWTQHASGFTNARWGILYRNTGTPSTSPLIAFLDLGVDRSNQGADLTINWNTQGIMRFL